MQPIVHQTITYRENFKVTNGFGKNNLIGSGSFGLIETDGMVVAIKVFKLHQERALRSFETECAKLKSKKLEELLITHE
ncbi:hypothetical protein RJ640_001987 [Escallonia rubra]|uniref:Protein kinase domain-containing protein n=1 Tax=Escallonia rubra TaxID=112253 RepID=A0AA88UVJ4_9ASTE|nr:hypothetical protein RJ640_001987 [Escallonia rubra]